MRRRSCIRHSTIAARAAQRSPEKVTCGNTAATAERMSTINTTERAYPRFVIVMTGR